MSTKCFKTKHFCYVDYNSRLTLRVQRLDSVFSLFTVTNNCLIDKYYFIFQAAIEDNINLEFEDDMDLGTVMTSWLSQIGHPVITISRSYSGDDKITATASQKRFLTDPTTDVTATHFPDLG